MKLLTLFQSLLKKACLGFSDVSSKIQQQTLTAQNCFLTKHQINLLLNLKWCTLYFSRKEKEECDNEDAHNIAALLQIPSIAPSVRIIKTKTTDTIFTDVPYLPHQMTYKNSPN